MANAPEQEQSELEPTDGECFHCSELFEYPDSDECPNDPDHLLEPIHVSKEPLGYEDDNDFYHHGRKQYEYPARDFDA